MLTLLLEGLSTGESTTLEPELFAVSFSGGEPRARASIYPSLRFPPV